MHLKNILLFCFIFISEITCAQSSFLNEKDTIQQKFFTLHLQTPHFLREGDYAYLTVTIANNSNKELTGQIQMIVSDVNSNNPVDGWFLNSFPVQYFTALINNKTTLQFPIQVPYGFNKPIQITVITKTDWQTDSVQKKIAIFSNRPLVKKTFSYIFREDSNFENNLKELDNANDETISNISFTAQVTPQPLQDAIQYFHKIITSTAHNPLETAGKILAIHQLCQQPPIWQCKNSFMHNIKNSTEQIVTTKLNDVTKDNDEEMKICSTILQRINLLKKMQQTDGSFISKLGKQHNINITAKIAYLINIIYGEPTTDTVIKNSCLPLLQQCNNFLTKHIMPNNSAINMQTILYYYLSYSKLNQWLINTKFLDIIKKQALQQNIANQALAALVLQKNNDTGVLYKKIMHNILQKGIEQSNQLLLSWPNASSSIFSNTSLYTQIPVIQVLLNADAQIFPSIHEILPKAIYTLHMQINKNTNVDYFQMIEAAMVIEQYGNMYSMPIQINLGNKQFNAQNNNAIIIKGNQLDTSSKIVSILPSKNNLPLMYGYFQWKYWQDAAVAPALKLNSQVRLNKKIFLQTTQHKIKIWKPLTNKTLLHKGDTLLIQITIQPKKLQKQIIVVDHYPACMQLLQFPNTKGLSTKINYYTEGLQYTITNSKQSIHQIEYKGIVTETGLYSSGITALTIQSQTIYIPSITLNIVEN